MQIIPVIDLMQNQVVHAKFGQRSQYRPIQSTLCDSSEPLAIVAALLELYPFTTLYIADLDAILGKGDHAETIEKICQTFPQLTIWLDSGVGQMNAHALYNAPQIRTVVGSENIQSLQDYQAICDVCESKPVLSLDYSAGDGLTSGAMGIAELHEQSLFWPDDTICMTLNTVGSAQGVDLKRLNQTIRLNLTREVPSKIYAAGGVRDKADLQALANMCLAGVLLATSLHNGNLSTDDIAHFHAQ
jgi:phosphoribosylformimino-5-aminoimidazole carboxamide ribotide isomerase